MRAVTFLLFSGCLALPQLGYSSANWASLQAQNETRQEDVKKYDEAFDRQIVEELNRSKLLPQETRWTNLLICSLTNAAAPFSSLHYDPSKSTDLSLEEKQILKDYLLKGGFLLIIADTYAHPKSPQNHSHPMAKLETWLASKDRHFQAREITAHDNGPGVAPIYRDPVAGLGKNEKVTALGLYYRERLCTYSLLFHGQRNESGSLQTQQYPLPQTPLRQTEITLFADLYLTALMH